MTQPTAQQMETMAECLRRECARAHKLSNGLFVISYGFTTIYFDEQGILRINHSGNMGSRIAEVRDNVDAVFGDGAFDAVRATGTERGSCDYAYTLVAKR